MNGLTLLGIAVGLAMDAVAVAVAAGIILPRITPRHIFRLSFHFGLFQFLMPLIGWFLGRWISHWVSEYDHWAAFGVLTLLGLKMLWEAFSRKDDDPRDDPTRGWMLVSLSLATSIDALAVGLSLALLEVSIWWPAIIIGMVAGTLTMLGMRFGSTLGARFGKVAEIIGGIVLIIIAIRVLLSHL